jgi:hypothetical protein
MIIFIPSTHDTRSSHVKHWPSVEFNMTILNTKENDITITEALRHKILIIITPFQSNTFRPLSLQDQGNGVRMLKRMCWRNIFYGGLADGGQEEKKGKRVGSCYSPGNL